MELADEPGALAVVAQACGDAGVNILSLRAFPGPGTVTDDMVLEIPDTWSFDDARSLLADAGGSDVVVLEVAGGDLDDEPTRWLQGALAILERPGRAELVVKKLMGPVSTPLYAEAQRILVLEQFALGRWTPAGAETTPSGAALGVLERVLGTVPGASRVLRAVGRR
ncbi:MAG: hypothetical protein ACM3UO_00570 [Bacillota bacterium]